MCTNRYRGKNIFNVNSYKLSFSTFLRPIMGILTHLVLLPVLFSCRKDIDDTLRETEGMQLTKASVSYPYSQYGTSGMDIFTFEGSGARHLDSYQHCEQFTGNRVNLRSGNGEKIVFACSNGQRSRQEWSIVNSMEALDRIYADLRKESRNSPCMTGVAVMNAGSGAPVSIEMRSLASEVVLRSVSCDFTGRAYTDRHISDVRVYLTNVNARCSITAEGDVLPTEIVNAGGLDEEDMETMKEPQMLMQEIPEGIRKEVAEVGLAFRCYPNASERESPGTPFTRLVIEGRIDGETFWWPIDINREESAQEQGIHRCRQYIYDVTITRKGSSSPEEVVETDAVRLQMNIRPWTEKDEYQVSF